MFLKRFVHSITLLLEGFSNSSMRRRYLKGKYTVACYQIAVKNYINIYEVQFLKLLAKDSGNIYPFKWPHWIQIQICSPVGYRLHPLFHSKPPSPSPPPPASSTTVLALEHHHVPLASPSSLRLVQPWNFRDEMELHIQAPPTEAAMTTTSSPPTAAVPEKKGKMWEFDMKLCWNRCMHAQWCSYIPYGLSNID